MMRKPQKSGATRGIVSAAAWSIMAGVALPTSSV